MRRILLIVPCLLVIWLFLVGAERRPIDQVSSEALLGDSQKSAEPTDGLNLVWYIPTEFWDNALRQDKALTEKARTEMLEALDDYFMIGVVRADISSFGAFTFHDEQAVLKTMKIEFINTAGEAVTLSPAKNINANATLILQAIRPILTQAMGPMGQNFHVYVYEDKDKAGKRLISPYERGNLRVTMKPISKEQGGVINFPMPFDSLYKSRICGKCQEHAHIRWNYCPLCGSKLPE